MFSLRTGTLSGIQPKQVLSVQPQSLGMDMYASPRERKREQTEVRECEKEREKT